MARVAFDLLDHLVVEIVALVLQIAQLLSGSARSGAVCTLQRSILSVKVRFGLLVFLNRLLCIRLELRLVLFIYLRELIARRGRQVRWNCRRLQALHLRCNLLRDFVAALCKLGPRLLVNFLRLRGKLLLRLSAQLVEIRLERLLIALAARVDHGWVLRVDNTGTKRAQIATVELVDGAGKAYEINKGLLGYALAGRTGQWQVPLALDADVSGTVKVRATVNSLPAEAVATVE